MQNDLKTLKETYVSVDKLEEVKNELANMKQTSFVNNYDCYVNKKRGGGMSNSYFMDSGPTGLPHISERKVSQKQTNIMTSPGEACSDSAVLPSSEQDYHKTSYRLIQNTSVARHEDNNTTDSQALALTSPALQVKSLQQQVGAINTSLCRNQASCTPAPPALETLSRIVSAEGQWKKEQPDEGWILA